MKYISIILLFKCVFISLSFQINNDFGYNLYCIQLISNNSSAFESSIINDIFLSENPAIIVGSSKYKLYLEYYFDVINVKVLFDKSPPIVFKYKLKNPPIINHVIINPNLNQEKSWLHFNYYHSNYANKKYMNYIILFDENFGSKYLNNFSIFREEIHLISLDIKLFYGVKTNLNLIFYLYCFTCNNHLIVIPKIDWIKADLNYYNSKYNNNGRLYIANGYSLNSYYSFKGNDDFKKYLRNSKMFDKSYVGIYEFILLELIALKFNFTLGNLHNYNSLPQLNYKMGFPIILFAAGNPILHHLVEPLPKYIYFYCIYSESIEPFNLFLLLKPFDHLIWILFIVYFIVFSLFLGKQFIFLLIEIFFRQGKFGARFKFIILIWVFLCMEITWHYETFVTTNLCTNRGHIPYDNLLTLLENGYKFIAFNNEQDSTYIEIYKMHKNNYKKYIHYIGNYTSSHQLQLMNALTDSNKKLKLARSTITQNIYNWKLQLISACKGKCKCYYTKELENHNEFVSDLFFGFYSELFLKIGYCLKESGIWNYFKTINEFQFKLYTYNRYKKIINDDISVLPKSLSLNYQNSVIFFLFLYLCSISILLFIFEFFIEHFNIFEILIGFAIHQIKYIIYDK